MESKKSGGGDPFAPPYLTGLCLGRMNGEDNTEYVIMVRCSISLSATPQNVKFTSSWECLAQ